VRPAPAPAAAAAGSDDATGRGGRSPRPSRIGSATGLVVKLALLALLNGLVMSAIPRMADAKAWPYLVCTVTATVAIDVVYLTRRAVPAKYLLPGTLFLLVFSLYPVGYTIYTSFTNYGTENNISKSQAIAQIEKNSVSASGLGQRYELQVVAKGATTGELAFLLIAEDGTAQLGTASGLTPVDPATIVRSDSGRIQSVGDYVALKLGDSNRRKTEIDAFRVKTPEGEIQNDGFTAAFIKTQRLRYEAGTNTVVDNVDGTVYHEESGAFVAGDKRLDPGWRALVGVANYTRIANNKIIRENFVRVFVWTFLFAVLSVVTTFALGLLLAMVFNYEGMKGRRLYRSLMIVPYAIPSFMTAIVWRGMLNQRFGVINRMLHLNVAWLDTGYVPYASILLVNLWLGFPYMFLVCTGALQGIPGDLKEAAFVDGATGLSAFRRVTFPLLLIAVAPLLIASFAFNFNNFNLIYLLTEGRPAVSGSTAGRTDILISYTFKLAFGGGRGAEYGFASAISVIIFFIVAGISAYSFRFTKTLEGVR
jgi:arabinogalactan oligomer/maltooligosaccharide transport system permease protein